MTIASPWMRSGLVSSSEPKSKIHAYGSGMARGVLLNCLDYWPVGFMRQGCFMIKNEVERWVKVVIRIQGIHKQNMEHTAHTV